MRNGGLSRRDSDAKTLQTANAWRNARGITGRSYDERSIRRSGGGRFEATRRSDSRAARARDARVVSVHLGVGI